MENNFSEIKNQSKNNLEAVKSCNSEENFWKKEIADEKLIEKLEVCIPELEFLISNKFEQEKLDQFQRVLGFTAIRSKYEDYFSIFEQNSDSFFIEKSYKAFRHDIASVATLYIILHHCLVLGKELKLVTLCNYVRFSFDEKLFFYFRTGKASMLASRIRRRIHIFEDITGFLIINHVSPHFFKK